MSLSKKEICSMIGNLSDNLPIMVYNSIDSTNTQAKLYAQSSQVSDAVFIASEQTAGRGRLGRSFVSNADKGLYLSILLNRAIPADYATSLTTYMAVIAARVIDSLAHTKAKIKWVNDIYLGGRKLAGILTEGRASHDGEHLSYAVIGIGINLLKQEFPDEIKDIATTLEDECGKVIDANDLAALIVKEFFENLHFIGTPEIASEYKSRSFLIGKDVTVIKPTKSYEATVKDITDRCELTLMLNDGAEEILSTGEVSVKYKA